MIQVITREMSLGRCNSLLFKTEKGEQTRLTAFDSAYNDMRYLRKKYAPLEGLGKYDSKKDPSVTGARIQVHT